MLETATVIFMARAEMLVLAIVGGMLVGEGLAIGCGIDAILRNIKRLSQRAAQKLNRPDRSVGRRIYRGVVVTSMGVAFAGAVGMALAPYPLASMLVVTALIGRAFATWRTMRFWRQVGAGNIPLELPGTNFLFADSHAVLRYQLQRDAHRFMTGVVGVAIGYLVGGIVLALTVAILNEITPRVAVPVYGWAMTTVHRTLMRIPVCISVLLLSFGALVTPGAKPFRALRANTYVAAVAGVMNLSLGGALAEESGPWVGTGSPKLMPKHFRRWLMLRFSASMWLVMLFAATNIYKILNIII